MNYKIACPLCQHVFSIKDPKPGKFKPRCSACSESFVLVVEPGDPIKIKVGKLPSVPIQNVANETNNPADTEKLAKPGTPTKNKSEVSIDARAISGLDATLEQTNTPSSRSGDVAATEATMGHAGSIANSGTDRSNVSKGRDFSVNEATMESNVQVSVGTSQKNPGGIASSGSGSPQSGRDLSSASSSPEMVSRLGGYKILSELGAGGMGSVYLAKQISLDRSCALKTIKAQWAKNPRVIARFIREAYAAAQLTHHNVVQIYDLGQDSGINFFSMELVSGGSLDDQLKAKGKLPPKLAATLILQAARGLKFAHDHGMVHRDIKPGNLMMTTDGLVKVADMGLVKTTSAEDLPVEDKADVQSMMIASARSQVTGLGSSMGTPAYMSPEQSMDATNVDKRADIYSLGCTFYALLTGKPPFDGNTLLEVISKHRAEKIVRPERIISGLPTALGDIIEKMTEKKPDDRYQDMEEVVHDLEVYLELREDTSSVQIIHQPGSMDEVATQRPAQMDDRPLRAQPEIPVELASQIQSASKRFYSSPLLIARQFLPTAWYGVCGAMAILSILFSMWAGFSLLGEGAKSIASQASSAVQNMSGMVAEGETASTAPVAAAVVSKVSQYYSNMASWFKTAVCMFMAFFLAPISAVAIAGLYGKSPLALRWREAFATGGVLEWLYWSVGGIVGLLAVHYLGLWMPVIVACLLGIGAGAGYYFGIDQFLAKQRKPSLDQANVAIRQLRLRGLEEEQICSAIAQSSGKNWEEFFESLFGYERMRTMRTKLHATNRTDLKVHFPRRDRMIDRWDAKLSETKREKDEKVLRRAGKAEMLAEGVSEAEANKRADAVAASMVDAATETRQTMHDIAAGKLTAHAAQEKRERIKQMISEARSGKVSNQPTRGRSLDRLLGQLFGSMFRFVCAAVLFLGVGMWFQANQEELQDYWQQTRSTIDSLKNTDLTSTTIADAKSALTAAAEKVQADGNKNWKTIGFGFLSVKNVLFVAISALLMLSGTTMSGWKKSIILVPIVLALCLVPLLL